MKNSRELDRKNYIRSTLEENNYTFVKSEFSFLMEHCGLRPGCMHLLLATAGSGKSSLVRSIIVDTARYGPVTVILSEESKEDFDLGLAKTNAPLEITDNIHIVTETDMDKSVVKDQDNYFKYIAGEIVDKAPIAIFWDNITTSCVYADKFNQQLEVSIRIKKMAKYFNVPVFLVAHTKKGVNDQMTRLLEDDDIRGTTNITNLVQYFYIMQRFQIGETYYPTLRIRKSRHHLIGNTMYSLKFNRRNESYVASVPINFHEFKKAFKERNVL